MTRLSTCLLATLLFATSAFATDFHIDPVKGDPSGDGGAARPWKSLQAVIDRGLIRSRKWDALPYNADRTLVPRNEDAPVGPGDTILLHDGYYGDVVIRGHYNEDFITIAAAEGKTPRLRSVLIQSGEHWALRGLHVSPEYGEGKKPGAMINLQSHGWNGPVHDMRVEDCVLQSTDDASDWTVEDWNTRASSGIGVDGTRAVIRNNYLKNVDSGINVGASHALVEHNTVENFAGDGLRGLGDYSTFQYNVVKNCYDVNDNHDDGFQSWSTKDRKVGEGEVVGMVLRGNTIINYTDPDQPHRGPLQGIGCFDGMFVDWTIENNVIVIDHYHGITLGGARDCRIVNNTVIDPNDERPGPAAIRVSKHKRGMVSSGCTVRNNLVTALSVDGEDMTVDHNIVVKNPAEYVVDRAAFDMRLKPGSPAIDAGSSDSAPKVDITGTPRPQGEAVDVGAYERPSE